MKLPLASSNDITLLTSGTSCEIADIRPKKNAPLAISSATVGPAGKARASMRRCGLPSLMP
jgi:hypothetical protein